MTTDFNDRFNKALHTTQRNNQRPDLDHFEPTQFWLDIGYHDKIEIDEGTETRFISLVSGIGLNELEDLTAKSSYELWRTIQEAWAKQLPQIMNVAKNLDPGEARIIGDADAPHGLQILLRRVNAEQPTVKTESNPFSRKLSLID